MPLADAIRNNYSADFKSVIMATAKELHLFKIDEQSVPGSGFLWNRWG
jgi:hypothetical protein